MFWRKVTIFFHFSCMLYFIFLILWPLKREIITTKSNKK